MLKTGLCYIELTTSEINCFDNPDNLNIDQQLFARVQYWSHDGKHLVVFFDTLGAYSDVLGDSYKISVADIDGNDLQLLEGEYRGPLENPWRPPLLSHTD